MRRVVEAVSASLVGYLAAGIVPAFAARDLPPFDQVDTNSDGRIDREEAAAIEGLDFDAADLNHDGSIDRSEYLAAATQQAGQ